MTDPRYVTRDVTESAAAPDRSPEGPVDPSPEGPVEPSPEGPTDATADGPTDRTVTMRTLPNESAAEPSTASTDASAADHHTPDHDTTNTSGPDDHGATAVSAPDTDRRVNDTDDLSDASASDPDPQATTQLPTTGWGSPSGSPSEYQSGSPSQYQPGSPSQAQPGPQSGAGPAAGPSWSSDETHDFPAYRPQSYPTYPPTVSQTTELPAVGVAGPPPTSAAAYGPGLGVAAAGPGAGGMTAGQPDRPRRRAGAGFAGALGLIGLAAAAYGAFALPVQKLGPRRSPYFVSLRELSTQKLTSSQANAHSVSSAGGHAATLWWRYGLAGALGVLALLLLVQICIPVLRRAAGVLLFLGALATIAGHALAVHQTNDYRSVVGGIQGTHRLATSQLGLGIWVAAAGLAVAALGGLIAAVQSTRR